MNKKRKERIECHKKLCEWSKLVRQRDGNQCQICGRKDFIISHHIIPKELKQFALDLNNGVALCRKCHKYNFSISPHRNALAFCFWLQKVKPSQYDYLKSFLEPITKPEEAKLGGDEIRTKDL